MQFVFFISLFTVFKYEPIKFLIQEDRIDEAVAAVRQMYKYADSDEIALDYINAIKITSG